MNGITNLPKVIEALEADPLLLEILGDVLLYDPGSPDVLYSQPLIPYGIVLERLFDYLKLPKLSMSDSFDVKII